MKQVILLITVITLLAVGFNVSCAAPGAAPEAEGPEALPSVSWTLQTGEVSHDDFSVHAWDVFAARVSERTNGKFQIRVVLGKELGIDRGEFTDAVADGTVEMAYFYTPVGASIWPWMGVWNLPYLTGSQQSIYTLRKVVQDRTVSSMKEKGYQPLSPLAFFTWAPQDLLVKEPIDDLSDLSGLQIRSSAVLHQELLHTLGASTIYMPITEVYLALQRGVVDGCVTGAAAMMNSAMYEVCNNYYPILLTGGGLFIIVNSEAFEALPDAYKAMIVEEADATGADFILGYEGMSTKSLLQLQENGVEVRDLTAAENEAWVSGAKPIWETWANEDPGNREVLELVKKAVGL